MSQVTKFKAGPQTRSPDRIADDKKRPTDKNHRPKPKAEPKRPALSGLGLRVRLESIPGLTDPSLKHMLPFYFQAPPLEEFGFSAGFNFQDYDTVGAGQFTTAQSRKLRTWSITTLFVSYRASWSLRKESGYVPNPLSDVAKLVQIAEAGSPLKFVAGQPDVWGGKLDLNLAATLREVRPVEKNGEIDARYVALDFVEYRHPDLQMFLLGKPGRIKLPETFTVSKLPPNRDTLHELAKFYYGSPRAWTRIRDRNGLEGVRPDENLKTRFAKQPQKKIVVPPRPKPKATLDKGKK